MKVVEDMDALTVPLILLSCALFYWIIVQSGPQVIFAERRKIAEANARAEEAKLQRAKLERGV